MAETQAERDAKRREESDNLLKAANDAYLRSEAKKKADAKKAKAAKAAKAKAQAEAAARTSQNTGRTTTATPGVLPSGNFGSTSGVNWPSAEYMRNQGLSESLITAYAGQPVQNTAYPKNQSGAVRTMIDSLTTAQSRQLFTPWIAQGFDPFAFRDSSKLANFDKQIKSFMPSVVSQGWDKVDPTEWTLTGGKATHTPKVGKIVGPGGTTQDVSIESTKQVTAYGTIQNELAAWGLGELTDVVFNKVFKEGISDPKQLTNFVRSTKQYKDNFQGMAEYNANTAHTQKITEQQYLMKAQAYMNTAQQYGLPDGFVTRKEIGQLVAGGVSPAEFNRRVVNGYLVAMNADPATKQALAAQGVDFGHLLAYYLDPKKAEPWLTSKANEAQLQGYAQNAGIANLTPTMAQELTQRAKSNINPDGTFSSAEEKQALDVAAQGQGLTAVAPGSNAQTVDTTQLIGTKLAGFGGTTQAEAQQATQKALQGQEAPFQKAGGYATTTQGVTGIGSSPQ